MVRAVLFDLDDTLFDHHGCSRSALQGVHESHACFGNMPFDDLADAHRRLLEELHHDVMLGRIPLDEARRERFRRLFGVAGVDASVEQASAAAVTYRDRYKSARRAIEGAAALLPLVRARARVGIVSNNLLEEQQEKLRHCGLDRFVDALVVSEEAGVSKPDPLIFHIALERLACAAADAVMVGDSWPADVIGARAAGVRAIWFNRHGAPKPDGADDVAEIAALAPPDSLLRLVFDAHRD
jgi:putative hydrolase of the HAD superfamily